MASHVLRKGERAGQPIVGSSVPRFVARPAEPEPLLPRELLLSQTLLLLLTYLLLARAHSLPLPSLLFLLFAHLLFAQPLQLRDLEPPLLLLVQVQYSRCVALKERGLR